MNATERQLWDWLADCEARKPIVIGNRMSSSTSDKAVRVLQYGVREGREADEADDV